MSTTNPRDIETEWDSLQRKYGNLPPKPVTVTEEERTKQLVDQLEQVDVLETKSLKQLEELEDDLTEDTLEKYRQRRLQELKQRVRRNRQAKQALNRPSTPGPSFGVWGPQCPVQMLQVMCQLMDTSCVISW